MGEAQRVTDEQYAITEFKVFTIDNGWRAVHNDDDTLVVERVSWRELSDVCMTKRISRALRLALEAMERE